MALKTLRMICAGDDKVVAEWDPETVAPERLTGIDDLFPEDARPKGKGRRVSL